MKVDSGTRGRGFDSKCLISPPNLDSFLRLCIVRIVGKVSSAIPWGRRERRKEKRGEGNTA